MDAATIFRNRLRQAVLVSTEQVAEEARQTHRFESHTGTLERSIQTHTTDVMGEVYLDSGVAKYAVFVHEGSRAHNIFPRRREALRWPKGNDFRFAKQVRHPGTKKDPFVYDALDSQKDKVIMVFNRYVDLALEDIVNAFSR